MLKKMGLLSWSDAAGVEENYHIRAKVLIVTIVEAQSFGRGLATAPHR
jgi:hypothetical protein